MLELCFLTSPALWLSVLDLGASVLGGRARETRSAGLTGLRSRPESMGGKDPALWTQSAVCKGTTCHGCCVFRFKTRDGG